MDTSLIIYLVNSYCDKLGLTREQSVKKLLKEICEFSVQNEIDFGGLIEEIQAENFVAYLDSKA